MPVVSIVTPCYNAEPFIADTIASVQNQTFEDWEHIVVDDDVFPVFERLVLNARDCVGDERLRIVTGRYDANYGHGSAVSGYSLLQKASRLLLPSNYLTEINVCAAFRSGAHVDVLDNAVELNLRLTNEEGSRLC